MIIDRRSTRQQQGSAGAVNRPSRRLLDNFTIRRISRGGIPAAWKHYENHSSAFLITGPGLTMAPRPALGIRPRHRDGDVGGHSDRHMVST